MADVEPNRKVEMQRLRAQIAEQRARIEAQRLQTMELADRVLRNDENIAAATKAIADYEATLKSLEDAHGPMTETEYNAHRVALAGR